jgi:hypothetical protein
MWSGLDAATRSTATKYIKVLFSETAKELAHKLPLKKTTSNNEK